MASKTTVEILLVLSLFLATTFADKYSEWERTSRGDKMIRMFFNKGTEAPRGTPEPFIRYESVGM